MNLNCLTVFFTFLPLVFARGPHHPRGATVVKRHTHYAPSKGKTITQDDQLLHDKHHIQEHLDEVAPKVNLSKMTDEELELYYFLLHDSDKNSKLDGLELLNAILHTRHQEEDEENQEEKNEINASLEGFNNFVELVDQVLRDDDRNQDGYLDYNEYVEGRKRAESINKQIN
ncbi:hypothetical protein ABEB36_005469 [Hypothenemus hampei]|uniref:EF-hand domain-containing protein n=1 Tax=Hypothenemus hampei TaxID=57062 RepID=A0ABD1EYC3_HYPHA